MIAENQSYRSLYHQQLASIPVYDHSISPGQFSFHEVERKQSNITKKKVIGMEKLKKQMKDVEDQLINTKETLHRLRFERNCMKKQLAEAGILPPIILSSVYLTYIQLPELERIEEFFQQRNSIHLEKTSEREEWRVFLQSTLGIPSSLHNSLVQKCIAYESNPESSCNSITGEKRRMEYYPVPSFHEHVQADISFQLKQHHIAINRVRRSSSSFLNKVCCNTLLRIGNLPHKTISKTSMISFWKDKMLGRSAKERLFILLTDGINEADGVNVKYIAIKQIISDYLHDHPESIKSIHQLEGLPYTQWNDKLCCHCCVYITTVSAAILFDLTGFMSTMIKQRDIVFSNLVRKCGNGDKLLDKLKS